MPGKAKAKTNLPAPTAPSSLPGEARGGAALSVRTRFEIFKRDGFTCRYCGRKSPDVVLEVDHIIPRSKNGTNDPTNLTTSCFDCNRGKSDRNLSEIITGEDPHDKAIEMLERERQLAEYNNVRESVDARIEEDLDWLVHHGGISNHVAHKFRSSLYKYSKFDISLAVKIAAERVSGWAKVIPYAHAILRNWKKDGAIS